MSVGYCESDWTDGSMSSAASSALMFCSEFVAIDCAHLCAVVVLELGQIRIRLERGRRLLRLPDDSAEAICTHETHCAVWLLLRVRREAEAIAVVPARRVGRPRDVQQADEQVDDVWLALDHGGERAARRLL